MPAIRRQPYACRAVFILCSTSIGLRNAHVNNVTQFLGFALDVSQQALKQSHACTRWLPAGKQQVGMVSSASPARCRLRLGIHRMPQKKKKRGEKKLLRGARCAHSAAAPPALHGTCTAPCARRASALGAQLRPLCNLCRRLQCLCGRLQCQTVCCAVCLVGGCQRCISNLAVVLHACSMGTASQAHWLTSGSPGG